MYILTVSDLSLSFGDVSILENLSFALDETDRLGIIGVNGCGKSTLFRLLTGELEPTSGSIYLSKGKTVGILTQDGAFDAGDGEQSVLERMYAAFPKLLAAEKRLEILEEEMKSGSESSIKEYTELHEAYLRDGGLEFRSRCSSILGKLGFDEYAKTQKVSTLSGGQKTRLALAIQLSRQPDLLLLDEPTNHLDIATLGWLEDYLSSYPKCFAVISHDRYFLDKVTNKTFAIENRKGKLYSGGYTKTVEQRENDKEIAMRHWKNQQKEIARQEAYIAQQRAWNRERNIIAAESRLKMLNKMEKLERPEDAPKGIRMSFSEAIASGNDVLQARKLSVGFPGRTLFRNVSFLIKRGDRALIIGPNGCGKSTLIKTVLGKIAPTEGVLEQGYHVEIGYYDQENQNLNPENTVLDELWNAYPTRTETQIRQALALFRFTGESVFREVSVLSGGERARLTLAKLMLSKMNFLVLDEPTNHLDMDSREALESALEQFEGTILMVSHDRYLIEKLATRILELKPGDCFDGDLLDYRIDHVGNGYSEFSAYKNARIAERQGTGIASPTQTVGDRKTEYLKNKQNAAEERKKKARIEKLTAESKQLEARLEEIEKELFGPAATDYVRAAELEAEKEEAENRLLEIYEALE